MSDKYELTKEHRAQLKPWADMWIKRILRTDPMTDDDKRICRDAVIGLYKAANLPPPKNIVFVPSPFVLTFAAGFAAAILEKERPATGASTLAVTKAVTKAATREATREATVNATQAATREATNAATWDATVDATREATNAATGDATGDATRAATWDATVDATRAVTKAATWAATGASTLDATRAVTKAATRAATWAATRDATWAATWAATRDATWDATRDATWDATGDATRAATEAATWEATREATEAATVNATQAATREATNAATWEATVDATWDATRDATEAATVDAIRAAPGANRFYSLDVQGMIEMDKILGLNGVGLKRARSLRQHEWNGGNQWGQYVSFISFFRHVAQLDIDYSQWDHYEQLAIHGGPRIMHPDFCMISDFPAVIHQDERHLPHCETGPFTQWCDGTGIYALHGTYIPQKYIHTPKDKIDPKEVLKEDNAEVRIAVIRHVGMERFINHLPHKVISEAPNVRGANKPDRLLEIESDEMPMRFLELHWTDKHAEKMVLQGVCRTEGEFNEFTRKELSWSIPNDINDCAQVRKWFMGVPQHLETGGES